MVQVLMVPMPSVLIPMELMLLVPVPVVQIPSELELVAITVSDLVPRVQVVSVQIKIPSDQVLLDSLLIPILKGYQDSAQIHKDLILKVVPHKVLGLPHKELVLILKLKDQTVLDQILKEPTASVLILKDQITSAPTLRDRTVSERLGVLEQAVLT